MQAIRKSFQRLMKDQKGLTLMELLVVVAILASLAAIVVPRVLDTLNEANRKVAVADAGTVRQAMERYLIDNRQYPADMKLNPGDAADSYDGLRSKLSSYVNLPNAAGASFTFVSYTPPATPGSTYSLVLKAKDKDETQITVTPSGVTTP